MNPLIEFRGVGKTFGSGSRAVTALEGIDLSVEPGEVFAVIGHSGAGKSTLVRLINALERADSGTVLVGGTDITGLPERQLRQVRRGIGMVFQQFNLLRSRTAFGNVAYPLKVAGWDSARREERVAELLRFVGLLDKAWHYPDQLSGGQQQRIGIARALATNPEILLADEATSALDPETTGEVLDLLGRINAELGITIVVITHEMDVMRRIADRVAVLDAGRLVEQGRVADVFANPAAETTRRFVRTVLPDRPSDAELARLRARNPGRLVTARIGGEQRVGAVLSAALAEHRVRFEVVHGGVEELGGDAFGRLTLELAGADEDVDALIAALRAVTDVEELAA